MNARLHACRVALFTGGIDLHYAAGFSRALASSGMNLDVICNSDLDTPEIQGCPNLRLVTLYRLPRRRNIAQRLIACILVYARLLRYAATSSSQIFHILWNYKFPLFDRTLLLVCYKLLGKRLVFTAHNVNASARDGDDSFWNRVSLRIQYHLVDHIFVHTQQMKQQLMKSFGVSDGKVSIIPFGVNDMVPHTSLSSAEARQRLGLRATDLTILFFGRIVAYKGVDLLVDAFGRLAPRNAHYRLVIAGEPMKESEQHWNQVRSTIEKNPMREQVLQEIRHIADSEIEVYFKAADVLALPYTQIFQSGVLFMSYSFGLPVIATNVGSFEKDIIPGKTGFVCRPRDPSDLARVIEMYFDSDLFKTLGERRADIQSLTAATHSWEIVADRTANVYAGLSGWQQAQCDA